MRLKAEQFTGALKQLAPVYFVTGDEPLQQGEVADAIRLAAKKAGYLTREVLSVETGFEWGELALAADSMSLFADKKLIDLRLPSGKPGTDGAKALIDYCQRLPEDTVLLITSPKVTGATLKTKWCQALDQAGAIVQVWPLDGGALIPFSHIAENNIGVIEGAWLDKLAAANNLEIYLGFFPGKKPTSDTFKSATSLDRLGRIVATYHKLLK